MVSTNVPLTMEAAKAACSAVVKGLVELDMEKVVLASVEVAVRKREMKHVVHSHPYIGLGVWRLQKSRQTSR